MQMRRERKPPPKVVENIARTGFAETLKIWHKKLCNIKMSQFRFCSGIMIEEMGDTLTTRGADMPKSDFTWLKILESK